MIVNIPIDDKKYVTCVKDSNEKYDFYRCPNSEAGYVQFALVSNGRRIVDVKEDGQDSVIWIDRCLVKFLGKKYTLKQCYDLCEWFRNSNVGDFTYYYRHIVFHCEDDRFYSAYIDDIKNFIQI